LAKANLTSAYDDFKKLLLREKCAKKKVVFMGFLRPSNTLKTSHAINNIEAILTLSKRRIFSSL